MVKMFLPCLNDTKEKETKKEKKKRRLETNRLKKTLVG
jgi:hypothetical protein